MGEFMRSFSGDSELTRILLAWIKDSDHELLEKYKFVLIAHGAALIAISQKFGNDTSFFMLCAVLSFAFGLTVSSLGVLYGGKRGSVARSLGKSLIRFNRELEKGTSPASENVCNEMDNIILQLEKFKKFTRPVRIARNYKHEEGKNGFLSKLESFFTNFPSNAQTVSGMLFIIGLWFSIAEIVIASI